MYKAYGLVLVILCEVCWTLARTSVTKCDDNALLPEVYIEGCEQTPCRVVYNQQVNFSLDFKSPGYLESIQPKTEIRLPIFNFTFPIASHQNDACDGILNTPCPLVQNEYVEYQYSVKLAQFPFIPFTLIFSIVDQETDNDVICFNADMFPVT